MNEEPTNTVSRDRQKSFRVDQREQFDALASATRFDLVEFLHSIGPCSIAELSEHMGTRADGLYHHIKKLVTTGLVKEVGFRKTGRRTEALFDVVADEFDFDTDIDDDFLLKLLRSINRRSERNFSRASERGLIEFADDNRTAHIRADTGRLTNLQLQKVHEHVASIIKIFAEGREQREGGLFTMSMSLMPFTRINSDNETTSRTTKLDRKKR